MRVAVKILDASVVNPEPPVYWTNNSIIEEAVNFTTTDALHVIVPVFWLGIPNGNCGPGIPVKYIPTNVGAVVYFNPNNTVNIYVPVGTVTLPWLVLLLITISAFCVIVEFIIFPRCEDKVGAVPNV